MIGFFKEQNTSKIPVDNGSSLNKLITKIINVLANITIAMTSVLGEVPLEPDFFECVTEVGDTPQQGKFY
jgi:hypothetical protein